MKNNKNQPNDPHHLPSNNRVATVCTNAEVKVDLHVLCSLTIMYGHYSLVKVDRLNFVFEKESNIRDGGSLVEEPLV